MNSTELFGKTCKQLLKRRLLVKNKILVGTHHKTGTVWFLSIFREIANRLGLNFVAHTHEDPEPHGRWDIFQNHHSVFDFAKLGEYRGLHVIRDPRDQIVSATHYHVTSSEAWLHEPREEFGGLAYQEKLNSFTSFDDKILFAMEGSAYHNIMSMRDFNYYEKRFFTAQFEDLIQDYNLERFEQIFHFLGFRGITTGWCLVAAYRNSLSLELLGRNTFVRRGQGSGLNTSNQSTNGYLKGCLVMCFEDLGTMKGRNGVRSEAGPTFPRTLGLRVRTGLCEVVRPHAARVVGLSRIQDPSFSHSLARFGCFQGTLSPSSRRIRSTRLSNTRHGLGWNGGLCLVILLEAAICNGRAANLLGSTQQTRASRSSHRNASVLPGCSDIRFCIRPRAARHPGSRIN